MKWEVHQSDYNIIFVSRCLPKEWLTPNALEATIAETRGTNNSNSGRIIAMSMLIRKITSSFHGFYSKMRDVLSSLSSSRQYNMHP